MPQYLPETIKVEDIVNVQIDDWKKFVKISEKGFLAGSTEHYNISVELDLHWKTGLNLHIRRK